MIGQCKPTKKIILGYHCRHKQWSWSILGEAHVTLPVYETDAVSAHMEKSAKQRAQQKKHNCIHDDGAVAGLDIDWKI